MRATHWLLFGQCCTGELPGLEDVPSAACEPTDGVQEGGTVQLCQAQGMARLGQKGHVANPGEANLG